MTGRLVIDDIRPRTPGCYPAKAVVGEAVPVRAAIFTDGHDILAARVLLFAEGSTRPDQVVALVDDGNDEWSAAVVPRRLGRHQLVVQAWTDRHATWAHKVHAKLGAGQGIDVELAEGELLLTGLLAEGEASLAGPTTRGGTDPSAEEWEGGLVAPEVGTALLSLRDTSRPEVERVSAALVPRWLRPSVVPTAPPI